MDLECIFLVIEVVIQIVQPLLEFFDDKLYKAMHGNNSIWFTAKAARKQENVDRTS